MLVRSVLALLLCGLAALAQDARGRIAGRVTDPSGAIVVNVDIKALHPATGVLVAAKTNESGIYELPYLAPGVYTLSATANGFRGYERTSLEIRAGERLQIDIQMDVGAVSETVTVAGQASLLETATASVGQVVDTRRILELPLPGGNALSLSRLTPGIVNLSSPNHPSLGPAVEVLSQLSVNGVRSGNIEFTVDGTPSMWGTNAAYAPPTELVSEFKVETVSYDASAGRAPGGNVNVVLRSGTNQLHSTLHWFHNNQALQGLDLFQRQLLYNPATGPVTDEKRALANPRNILNRFGAVAGGPVILPKLYDGRNKTFWVYGMEGLTRPGVERGNTFFTVPTAAQRTGDFSALLPLGPTYQIYDPATIAPAPNGRYSRQPFPGNLIPRSRLNQTALGLLDYWPAPNTEGTADGRQNFRRLQISYNEFWSHTAKVDHNFSERHRAFVRYNQTYQLFTSGQVFENTATGNDRHRYNYGLGIDNVYVINAQTLLNVRYGVTRFQQKFVPLSSDFDLTAAGFSPALAAAIDPQARKFPQISVQGLQTLGTASASDAVSNYNTLAGDLSRSRGKHNLRFGTELRVYREHNYNFAGGSPQITFGPAWTRGPLDNSPNAPIGPGFASFLLGIPSDGQINANDSAAEQSWSLGFYVQDDWRLTPALTLNLGLRYDFDSAVTERFNRSVRGFDFITPNPIDEAARRNYAASPIPELPVSVFRALGGLTFAGAGSRALWDADGNNFAPRIGIAWKALPKLVVRTGYGIYFVPLGVDRMSVNQSGFSQRTFLVASTDNGQTFAASLANPFPDGIQQPLGASGGLSTDVGKGVSFFHPAPRNGYMQRYSFGVQYEFPRDLLLDVSYIGNRGTKLSVTRQYNPVPNEWLSKSPLRDQAVIDRLSAQVANPFFPLPATDIAGRTVARSQLLRPYPHFTGISASESIGYSWYHSLQARTERRFKNGFTFQVGYTWSKMMEATEFLNGSDLALAEAISDLDRPHRITGSGIWELPFGRSRSGPVKHLTGGWQLQAVWQRNTGAPIGFGNALLLDDIRNVAVPAEQRPLDRWFNTGAFNRNPAQQLASNVRTLPARFSGIRASGVETWDISAVKNFQLAERWRMQLRAEALNAMNRSNLAGPNTDPVNSLFGRISATTGFPRYLHFGLKIVY
jgi:outer membrane receptor protein involved in Fe transport